METAESKMAKDKYVEVLTDSEAERVDYGENPLQSIPPEDKVMLYFSTVTLIMKEILSLTVLLAFHSTKLYGSSSCYKGSAFFFLSTCTSPLPCTGMTCG